MTTITAGDRPARPASREELRIAIVCALSQEAEAVEAVFDVCWDHDRPLFNKLSHDPNNYTIGAIGRHNVVLAHVPGKGTGSAASVARACMMSFPNISLGVIVGVCGVVPGGGERERVLGDVIISEAVIEYDFGFQTTRGFERTKDVRDVLPRPPPEIRAMLSKLEISSRRTHLEGRIAHHLKKLQPNPALQAKYPGKEKDRLFEPTYIHRDEKKTCEEVGCSGLTVPRKRLLSTESDQATPAVHIGMIASGNAVVVSGAYRDKIAVEENIIAFEMEGAGAWDCFPCVVIKGACDYADSHKNDVWKRYAAATAACCLKAFLNQWAQSGSTLAGASADKHSHYYFDVANQKA